MSFSFRKFVIIWQISALGYFVYSKPNLAKQILASFPVIAKQAVTNPKEFLKFLPGREDSVDYKKLQAQAQEIFKNDQLPTAPVGSKPLEESHDTFGAMEDLEGPGGLPPVAFDSGSRKGDSVITNERPHEEFVAEKRPELIGSGGSSSSGGAISLPKEGAVVAKAAEAPPVPTPLPPSVGTAPAPPAAQVAGTQIVNTMSSFSSQGGDARAIVNEKLPESQRALTEREKALEAAYQEAGLNAPVGAAPPAQPPVGGKPAPGTKTAVLQIEQSNITIRYLHFVFKDFTIRFFVESRIDDRYASKIVTALKNACLRTEGEPECSTKIRGSVIIDPSFYADLRAATVDDWSTDGTPTGVWRLTCANGGEDCMKGLSRNFRLTSVRAPAQESVLARGFEASRPRTQSRAPASTANRVVLKAYVTQISARRTSVQQAGSL